MKQAKIVKEHLIKLSEIISDKKIKKKVKNIDVLMS